MQCWPAQMLHLIMVALAKPSGGTRLIGVLPTLLRVWGRIRRPLADAWEGRTPHHIFWGTAGKSTTDAAFDTLIRAETTTLQAGWGGHDLD